MKKINIINLLTFISTITYGQTCQCLEYTMRTKGTNENNRRLVAYFHEGNSINEDVDSNQSIIELIPKDSANTTYRLSNNKTYFTMPDHQLDRYQIKYLRDEKTDFATYKVVKVATHETTNFDVIVWITDKIKNYESYMVGSVNSIDFSKLKLALKENGINGFPVRIGYDVSMDSYEFILNRYGNCNLDYSWFSLKGYTEQKAKTVEQLYKEGRITEEQKKAMQEQERRLIEEHKNQINNH